MKKSRSLFSSLVLLALLLLSLLTSCESRRTIVNRLDEKEANEIVVFLAGKGIDASKVQNLEGGGAGGKEIMWDISVLQTKGTEAMAILNANGLPRRRGQSLLGLFSGGGLVPSEKEEKVRYQAGLAEQIASTIRKIDGILDADVQLSFPEEDNLIGAGAEKKQKATASVYIKHQGVLDDPNSHLITKIKRLVAASVNGLGFDEVTVIADRARFSDVTIQPSVGRGRTGGSDREYVKVWTMIIAQESITSFRVVFFTFITLILLLGLSLVWVLWKTFPLLSKSGGVMGLFHLKSLEAKPTKGEEGKKEGATAPAAGAPAKKAAADGKGAAAKAEEEAQGEDEEGAT